jgi:hypothetical protein
MTDTGNDRNHNRPTPGRPAAGFLIDPCGCAITPYSYNGDWRTIAPAIRIGSSPFTVVTFEQGDTIFIDDEGLLKPLEWFFAFKGARQPFAGMGLVLGSNGDGDTVSARITLEALKARVLHLRIVAKRPPRFLALPAMYPDADPKLMTLRQLDAWMGSPPDILRR